MEVVGLDKGSDFIKQLPKPERMLGVRSRYHYDRIGKTLIASGTLKRIHLMALELLAVEYEIYEWAIKEMNKVNKIEMGSGYVQTFKTGARQISVEMGVKNDAFKKIMQLIKQFGLDPKSEKELVGAIDPNQGDLWNGFNKLKSSM